jgi:hypothetical protein
MQIEAVELLANLEEEDAEHQHGHQNIERDAELHDHRHAISRAHRAEEEPVLHRQEPDHLRHRLAAGDHHEEREQDYRDGNADGAPGCGVGEHRDRLSETEREHDDQETEDHRSTDIEQRLGVPIHLQPPDQPMQQPR